MGGAGYGGCIIVKSMSNCFQKYVVFKDYDVSRCVTTINVDTRDFRASNK